MIAPTVLPESSIREAAAEVFARSHFTRTRGWFDGLVIPLPDWSPRVWWTLVAVTLAMIAIAALARRIPQGNYGGARGSRRATPGAQPDSWLLAQDFAARGDHVAALHALFAALVVSLGRAQQVDPHPAKTVGDYARELSSRRSPMASPFHHFAFQYERALYGGALPDRRSFESLFALAQPLTRDVRVDPDTRSHRSLLRDDIVTPTPSPR